MQIIGGGVQKDGRERTLPSHFVEYDLVDFITDTDGGLSASQPLSALHTVFLAIIRARRGR